MLQKGEKKLLDNIFYTLCHQLVKLHDPNNHFGLLKNLGNHRAFAIFCGTVQSYGLILGFIFAYDFRNRESSN